MAHHTHIGRAVPEAEDEAYRELLEGSYRIIYHVEDDELIVLMVLHGARLLQKNMLTWRTDH